MYLVIHCVLQLSKGRICDVILYSMQSGNLPLLNSRSGQSDDEEALNFYKKFELDCTRCLWNKNHSVQAQITLLDVIFMIIMKLNEKNVCEENKIYKYYE